MIRPLIIISLLAASFCSFTSCGSRSGYDKLYTTGPGIIPFRAVQFGPGDVKLLEGPFRHATDLDMQTLLGYEPDRLLARFYTEAGLKPKAEQYHGWEDETIAGHSLGHYLSAVSMMYRTTGDSRFLERETYIVSELKKLQDHDGDGYIGAFPRGKMILTREVAKGNIRSQGFDLNGIWVPFYTEHKIMAGLRDAYHFCGDTVALAVEKRFAGWLHGVVRDLNDEQVQQMLKCEHGGIAEVLADLYADTGDETYLKMARIFYQKAVLDPLKKEEDILPGRHCNTNIPKLIGLARLYELTGDTGDMRAAQFFWNTVVHHHSYVTGGNGNSEYFGPEDKLRNRLGDETTETCNVYNMLKLTEHLFEWEAGASQADFYERALLNHILSSQNPVDGHVTYNLSLDMGGFKSFQDPGDFTCCIGTGMENHSKYGLNIYYHNTDELFLFQYIASELTWKEKSVVITQKTAFPGEQQTEICFRCTGPVDFTVMVRCPYWAGKDFGISVNGRRIAADSRPGSFIPVRRTWKNGDLLNISFPFRLRLESMPDDSNRVAVMYGPLVMAGDLGPVKDTATSNPFYVPVMMNSDRNLSNWIKKVDGKSNTFTTVNTGRPRDVELRPFYTFFDRRYSVYWDLYNEQEWKTRKEAYYAAKEFELKTREATVDFVQPGQMQSERDHKFSGEKTSPSIFRERACRESRGGWFSYSMKCDPINENSVVAEYWGGFPGARTFDILVSDRIVATENISLKNEGQFITSVYDLPLTLTKGRNMITLRLRAHENNSAGPLFGMRIIRK
ncbi:MAG TPA: beta-L-arabinofuranosidase domain-containing protein [Bacteroidales bacterium]|nr:beta-L-arabinofuranosidase domain-containing protein [Bacteroidales bacterium]